MRKKRRVHLAWIGFQRRQVSISQIVQMDVFFLPTFGMGAAKALSYLLNWFRTVYLLLRNRPSEVWLQLPQIPIVWAALFAKFISGLFGMGGFTIIADCHNGLFRDKWRKFPFWRPSILACDFIVIHTEAVLEEARGLLGDKRRIVVLGDPPAKHDRNQRSAIEGRPLFVFPASFAEDEPIYEVVEAARRLGEFDFILTGDSGKAKSRGHSIVDPPANVRFTGFLAVDEFNSLLEAADVILALTRLEGIQLSVCNEAIGYGKAVLASDTAAIRNVMSDAAEYWRLQSGVDGLASACVTAYSRRKELQECASLRAHFLYSSWLIQFDAIVRGA